MLCKKEITSDLNLVKDDSPLRLLNFDDMLSPYSKPRFENTISKEVWERLRTIAKERLRSYPGTYNQETMRHLNQIDLGFIPFGYTLESEF